MDLKRIFRKSNILLIIIVILLLISICMYFKAYYLYKEIESELKDYNELITNKEDTEGNYVMLNIKSDPYQIAERTIDNSVRKYYFVFDENNYIYIVRLKDSTVNKIRQGYEKNPEDFSYELKGYIYNTENELKRIAINAYNEGRNTNLLTFSNFKNYLGSTYLDEGLTPSADYKNIFIICGVLIDVLTIIVFIVYVKLKKQR